MGTAYENSTSKKRSILFWCNIVILGALLLIRYCTVFENLFTANKETLKKWYPHFGISLFYFLKLVFLLQIAMTIVAAAGLFHLYRRLQSSSWPESIWKETKIALKEFVKYAFALLITISIIELISLLILIAMNDSPFTKRGVFAQSINGYYVTQNTPGYSPNVFDGLDHYKPARLTNDENGFVCSEPITRAKSPNTIRIFIIGGSTAYGYMETQNLTKDKTYPQGIYSYNSSIAGIVKSNLSKIFADKKIEVINAAVVSHAFHQGYLMYMTLIHDFKPDIVINIDGYNEAGSLLHGADGYFDFTEKDKMEDNINLETRQRMKRWPFSFFLTSYWINRLQSGPGKLATAGGGGPI